MIINLLVFVVITIFIFSYINHRLDVVNGALKLYVGYKSGKGWAKAENLSLIYHTNEITLSLNFFKYLKYAVSFKSEQEIINDLLK